jgi:hypothetical protein
MFSLIVLLSITFLNIKPSYGGILTASIDENGIINLHADFNEDFECRPEDIESYSAISEDTRCFSVRSSEWSVSGTRKLWCPKKGRSRSYTAGALGGEGRVRSTLLTN